MTPTFGAKNSSDSDSSSSIKSYPNDYGSKVGGVKSSKGGGVKGGSESESKRSSICDIFGANQVASEFKLPPNVIPKHYNLELDIDLHTLTYRGQESIFLKFDRMKSRRQKDVIKLHSVDLNLTKVALYLNTKSKDSGIDGEYFYTYSTDGTTYSMLSLCADSPSIPNEFSYIQTML